MPLPRPSKSEKEKNDEKGFISRCMSDENSKKEFPNQKQRVAYCFSTWKQSKKKKTKASNDSIGDIDIIVVD